MKRQRIKVANIHVPTSRQRKGINSGTVDAIAASIKEVGLRNPISVVFKNDFELDGELVDNVAVLVAGAHRRAALLTLGDEFEWVECDVFEDEYTADLWEVSENLHRHDLTIDERSDHRRAWIRLRAQRGAKDGQLDQLSAKGGRGNEGGLSLAVREMPKLDGKSDEAKRSQLRRDLLIASRTEEAKEVCRDLGLGDNQSALIEVAKALPEWVESQDDADEALRQKAVEAQIAKAHEIKERQQQQAEINRARRAAPKSKPTPTADEAVDVLAALETIAGGIVEAQTENAAPRTDEDAQFDAIVSAYQVACAAARARFEEWAGLR